MNTPKQLLLACLTLATSGPAWGQSLYERPPTAIATERTPPAEQQMDPTGAPPLAEVSLLVVEPPKPREFNEHDLVTIIVSERSKLDRKLETDTEKKYTEEIAFAKFIDLLQLLEMRIEQVDEDKLPEIALKTKNKLEADAKTKQEDQFTDRLTARILEVKPNGTLVLEARRSWTTDEDSTVVTLSGICRSEDVTDKNTIQSNQMFDVAMNVQNMGEMRRTNTKGLIPRVLETIFNF
jgi:flagellar L-ring protein precursor FlgH